MRYLLTHAIDQAAACTPDAEAVRCTGGALTYADLARRTDQLAHVLAEAGVQRGDRVGILLDKSLRSAVALYGIMKAGAAYVPLDPAAPAARLAFILRDCGIRHLVTDTPKRRTLHALRAEDVALDVSLGIEADDELPGRGVPWSDIEAASDTPPEAGTTEQDLAYILYTSGSTGVPKGVMHTHRSGLSWAEVAAHTYGFRPTDRISNHAPLHFDLSTLDYFATAIAGATTVVIPEMYAKLPASFSKLIADERLTVLYLVPFALTQLLLHGALEQRDLSALRWVLFAGEPFTPKHLRALMKAWPHARFSNVYGPTEVNAVTYHDIPAAFADDASDEPLPIGKPYGNVEALVVDDADHEVAPGETGELLIHSPTMMRGYWGRPDLNATAFYRRPVFEHFEDVFYRTGDLVQEDAEGAYRFLGRKDRQIKTRGYRVELSEVEAVLAAHAAVTAAAVYTVPDEQGTHRIEAAVTVAAKADVSAADLRQHAANHLPPYAVPEAVEILDHFPRTSTGKIDRQGLQAQAVARQEARPEAARAGDPRTA